MNDTSVPAGWHPDPHDPHRSVRWWDGGQWTHNVQPHPQAQLQQATSLAQPPVGGPWQGSTNHWAGWQHQPLPSATEYNLWRSNQRSWRAIIITVVYALITYQSGLRLLGITPVLAAIYAVSKRERLAPVAVVAAVIAVLIGLNVIPLHHGSPT